jgi:HlyD family secretion protein
MSKKTKKLLKRGGWLLTLAVLGLGVTLWRPWAQADSKQPPRIVTAQRGRLTVSVTATGTVEPPFVVEIKSKASGEVTRVAVEEGQTVQKGARLARLDPIVERRRVNKAKAELRMARARVNAAWRKHRFARAQLGRERSLLEKGLASAETVDTRAKEAQVLGADALVAQAQVHKAKEALQEATDRLDETDIHAPIAGTVLERLVQPGQIVASGTSSVSGGTTLFRLADLSQLFVRMKVDEADVAKLAPGQAVRITADALPGQRFGGQVLRIAPQGTVESNVTVFQVVVSVDAAGSRALRPMMSANVEVVVKQRPERVLLPRRALQRHGRQWLVQRASGAIQVVRIGRQLDGRVEVLEGLQAGARVRLPSLEGAAGGARGPRRGSGRNERRKRRGMRRMMGGGR